MVRYICKLRLESKDHFDIFKSEGLAFQVLSKAENFNNIKSNDYFCKIVLEGDDGSKKVFNGSFVKTLDKARIFIDKTDSSFIKKYWKFLRADFTALENYIYGEK